MNKLISKYPNTITLKGTKLVLQAINLIKDMNITSIYEKLATEQNLSVSAIEQQIRTVKSKTEYKSFTNNEFIYLLREEFKNEL